MKKTKDAEQIPLQGTEEAEMLARLAERVERAVATIGELRRERERLSAQVADLTGQLSARDQDSERFSGIEDENSRFREERDAIRERIETMLSNLESLEDGNAAE